VTEDSEESARRAAEEWPTQYASSDGPVSATLRQAPGVGQRVGKYVVERTIGHGGMGIVVAARHETLDEKVAIKVLHPKAAKDAMQVERFVREARATVRIKSEHVVRVLDAGAEESTGAPFIVMELLEGRDLGDLISSFGPVPVQTAVDYIIQICEGLGAAHALGIVHRDLKPSTFYLTQRADGTAL
jgi:serine/threonine-protein kinase